MVGKSEKSEVVTLVKRDRPGLADLLFQKMEEDEQKKFSILNVKKNLNQKEMEKCKRMYRLK